ncbi:MAG: hypothetical protein M9927_10615 [Anaerolineae bacterium]|nr:hypothetical protein [Anaerolineae bacterium]
MRRTLTAAQWQSLAEQLPPGALLLALTSIHWREAWKYGERAFRYCNHDIGHAIAAVAIAAAVMGWRASLLETVPDAHLATLLGIAGQADEEDEHLRIEAEHPDCLLVLYPATDPAHSNRLAGINDSQATEVATTRTLSPRQPAGRVDRLARGRHAQSPQQRSPLADHRSRRRSDCTRKFTRSVILASRCRQCESPCHL